MTEDCKMMGRAQCCLTLYFGSEPAREIIEGIAPGHREQVRSLRGFVRLSELHRGLRATFMVMALGGVASASAASQVTVNISGTVLATPPCVINNERPITASFGDVLIDQIDGSYKTITLPYELDCSRAATNQVRMQVQSYYLAWFLPGSMLVMGNSELAITFLKDGSKLALNTWTNFDATKKPVLQAVLSKRGPDSEIIEGTFAAAATLMVEYR